MLQVVWFKRDLRVVDHRPLVEAARRGPVLPLYIVEDEILNAPDYSSWHYRFTRQALVSLRAALAAIGQPLVVHRGEAVEVLEAARRKLGIAHLWAHEETGNGISYARDRRVRRWARESGVPFTEFPQNGVVRRLASRDGWSRNWEVRMAEPLIPAPDFLPPLPDLDPGAIPPEDDLPPFRMPGGALQNGALSTAQETLDSFLSARGFRYNRELSSPATADSACSRLSPFLALGQLSMRQVAQAARARLDVLRGASAPEEKQWRASLRAFDARLHWHCHFMQKLEDEPRIERENFVRAFDGMRENDFREDLFQAWCEARTGYPFVDACMNFLRHHGWINFRMRAMLVSFASYHLWLHWRQPALHLARLFTDYEPGIHYSQFQMQSATTGINAIRIYNPAKQALDQDPNGEFVRRWSPDSPSVPIVDHAEAVRAARQRITAFRRLPAFRSQIGDVVERHGSRKRPIPKRAKSAAQGKLFPL